MMVPTLVLSSAHVWRSTAHGEPVEMLRECLESLDMGGKEPLDGASPLP